MFVFWIIAKSAVFPVIVVSKNKRYPEFILYGLGDVMCRGHDGHIKSRPGSSVRGHAGFGAVVRTSEPVAHKPLGAGSSVLSSKDFRPQLEQRHVLIRTDNMSVVSYINHQGGV